MINISKSKILNIIPFLICYELTLGGGGRLIEIPYLSLRMILFMLALVFVILKFLQGKSFSKAVILYVIAFFAYILYSIVIGLSYGHSLTSILIDIKPLLFITLILYISITPYFLKNIFHIIKVSSLILGIGYLIAVIIMRFNLIPFDVFYHFLNSTGEFFFRGNSGFVYKGFLYLVLGTILFALDIKKHWYNKYIFLILCVAIYLTYSRGFLLTLSFVLILGFIQNLTYKRALYLYIASLFLPILVLIYFTITPSRDTGDLTRLNDLRFLYDHFSNIANFIIGNGFGSTINNRPQIEVSILDILFRSGLIGLIFWLGTYIYMLMAYIQDKNETSKKFILLTTAIYVQSLFNPYMNNPIGIFFILISMVYFINIKNQNNNIGNKL